MFLFDKIQEKQFAHKI